MNIDELRSVQDAERNRSDLQPLRESFYEEAGEYIAGLKRERDRAAAEAADPFSDAEVRRLSDEIDTAEEVVEAVYERRLGKIVERASLAASDMNVDEDGLTAEERALFGDLVERMRVSKRAVLDTLDPDPETAVDDGTGHGGTDPGADRTGDEVSAADLMGDGATDESDPSPRDRDRAGADRDRDRAPPSNGVAAPNETTNGHASTDTPDPSPADGDSTDAGSPGGASLGSGPGPDDGSAVSHDDERPGATDSGAGADRVASRSNGTGAGDGGAGAGADPAEPDRVTVRITRDVGEILGVDDRQYDLAAEDVVRLPATNAAPLVERGAAERLD